MEIEAVIAPIPIRLEKHCKNYAVRILQLGPSHPMQKDSNLHINFPIVMALMIGHGHDLGGWGTGTLPNIVS
jgi:hypothetical protein